MLFSFTKFFFKDVCIYLFDNLTPLYHYKELTSFLLAYSSVLEEIIPAKLKSAVITLSQYLYTYTAEVEEELCNWNVVDVKYN